MRNRIMALALSGIMFSAVHVTAQVPGGTILYTAHQGLESITLDRETLHYKDMVAVRYAELVYYGQWFHPDSSHI